MFIERKLNLQPDCLIIDLDDHSHIQTFPKADYAIWLDWHLIVSLLGDPDDASEGLRKAQDGLWLASCKYDNLFFAADGNQPPLDQYCHGVGKNLALKMFFNDSTCYTSVISVGEYKGRIVYWGSRPLYKWTEEECIHNNIRSIRMANIGEI